MELKRKKKGMMIFKNKFYGHYSTIWRIVIIGIVYFVVIT